MNVLLTCAGRRNYLIGYFREALGGTGSIYAADASSDAPALQEADRGFVVPTLDDPGYFEALLGICREHQVHLLLSLSPDEDLKMLVASWKSFTARKINTLNGRAGPLWQRDYFDRLIRDGDHFRNVVRYIRRNAERSSQSLHYEAPWV